MGFQMMCDRCGRHIKNVPAKDLKKSLDYGDEIICKQCEKWEQAAQGRVDKLIRQFRTELESYAKGFKDIIMDEIRGSKPDGTNTRDVG